MRTIRIAMSYVIDVILVLDMIYITLQKKFTNGDN
jgi:hypothetical protein